MTTIKRVDGLGSPAAIRHDGNCQTVLVDGDLWNDIPTPQRRFIILHELAHCTHNVFSEVEADTIAFRAFMAEGGHPQDAIDAIADNLPGNPGVPGRLARINQLMTEPMCDQCTTSHFSGPFFPSFDDIADDWEKDLEDYAEAERGYDTIQDPEPQPKGRFWDALEAVANSAGQIFGQRPRMYNEPGYTPPASGSGNTTGWLIGGAVAALLIVLFVISKKKG